MNAYKNLIKPLLFKFDAELVHETVMSVGELFEESLFTSLLSYQNKKLERTVCGIKFKNPIGLAAGFDYNGHAAKVMSTIGFGFNTVGTVTAKPYSGNPKPRLGRLPKSQSLFVNKGFRNDGVEEICKRLEEKDLTDVILGISVGSAIGSIDEYLECFEYLKNKDYVKYFELNISCPNLAVSGSFYDPKKFTELVKNIKETCLPAGRPIFVKMPNEITSDKLDPLIKIALKHGLNGVILSNLVKDRTNKYLNEAELAKFKDLKGNFSGKPCFENSNKLIAHVKKTFGNNCVIIGCGGVFNATDAMVKFSAGADLVQLITGLIFEGPQIAGQINRRLCSNDQALAKTRIG